MAAALPFDAFLGLLRTRGFAVGLHEHMALAKLLSRWDGTSRPEFGDALAALIGRNEDEIAEIRRLFDEVFAERPAAAAVVDVGARPVGRRELVRRYVWATAAVVACLALGIGVWRLATRPAPPATPSQTERPVEPPPVAVTEPITVPPPPEPEPPPIPRHIDWSVVIPPVLGLFLLALAGFWAQKSTEMRRRWLADAWASTVGLLPGPFHFPFVLKDPIARLPRIDIEDAATILGRAITNDTQTRTLDVKQTVRQTVCRGLLPTFVFRPRRVVQTILVLQDVSEDMRIWRGKVDLFLTDLRRQGIPLERYYFDGDIRRLSDAPHRASADLDHVLRRRPGAPVLVISNGSALAATFSADAAEAHRRAGRPPAWRVTLAARERRSWLTPVSDTRLWPTELDELPVRVWPMTRRGLAQAARDLVGIDAPPLPHVRAQILAVSRVSQDGIERMKRLAALVPYASLELLELLRRQFAPDVPDAVLLHLAQEGGRPGAPVLRLADEELRRLQSAMRFETPKLEARVRRALVGVLQESEPTAGSAAHVRWQIAMAVHQAALAQLGEGPIGETARALDALARGPLWEEVQRLTSLAPGAAPLDRVPGSTGAAGAGWMRRAAGGGRVVAGTEERLPSSDPPPGAEPMPWTWPGIRELAPAGLIAAVLLALGWQLGMLPVRALAHVPDAYALGYQPGPGGDASALQVGVNPNARDVPTASIPRIVDLYRNDTAVRPGLDLTGGPVSVPLESRDRGGYFQVRAALPEGNLALSPAVWVPGEQVVVLIDAQPWARVTIEGDQAPAGAQTTPFSAALKPGTTYQLRMENGGLTPPLERTITVPAIGATGERTFRFTMPGFDPNQTASQLSGAAAERPATAR